MKQGTLLVLSREAGGSRKEPALSTCRFDGRDTITLRPLAFVLIIQFREDPPLKSRPNGSFESKCFTTEQGLAFFLTFLFNLFCVIFFLKETKA